MPNASPTFLSIVMLVSLCCGTARAQTSGPDWFSVSPDRLCVTEGAIDKAVDHRLSVDVSKMRAYVNTWTAQGIEARFIYRGPTTVQTPLASGEMRRQFGLKLRAQDGCNLVYAIWRFEPAAKLVVSVKSNPGEHTSAACGNRGYRNIPALKTFPLPPLRSAETHTLRAEMDATKMTVFADDTLVWQGSVGPMALSFDGPVGIRSDNVRLELTIRAKTVVGVHPNYVMGCQSNTGESD